MIRTLSLTTILVALAAANAGVRAEAAYRELMPTAISTH